MTSSHTAENIRDSLSATINEWNLERKINCVVTDNASNIVNAIIMLGSTYLRCFAHTLSLIANDGLKNITALREKCRNIVSYFHRSVTGARALEATQTQVNIRIQKLIQEVSTRWNSIHEMLSRLEKQEEAVKVALARLDNPVCGLEKRGLADP